MPLKMPAKRVAIVHEWLEHRAGSERVFEELMKAWPQADLFSLVDFLPPGQGRAWLGGRQVKTSILQKLPMARRSFRYYLPIMPLLIEQFDLSAYDLVISSSHAVAKGVLTRPDQIHVSYVHTPFRYAWDLTHTYLRSLGPIQRLLAKPVLHYLRLWDVLSAGRPDVIVANSRHVAARICKEWRREATVVYPPVNVARFRHDRPRSERYIAVSRLVPYKRVDLLIEAFNQLALPLDIIGDGSERHRLQRLAGPTVRLLGHLDDEQVTPMLERAKAFVFAAEEDFGIAPVEAMASGTPVIAWARGGCGETVLDGQTGILYREQGVDSICAAVRQFIERGVAWSPDRISGYALRFSRERFRAEIICAITEAIAARERPDDHQINGTCESSALTEVSSAPLQDQTDHIQR
jgi:glycosyltransferase involved in cell wall biosynthesis